MSEDVCRRCGGTGLDPEHAGVCECTSVAALAKKLLASIPKTDLADERVGQETMALAHEALGLLEDVEKWYVKARVYGAIAFRFREALEAIATPGSTGVTPIAKEALDWRHSEKGGVPMKAIDEMNEILNSKNVIAELRSRIESGITAYNEIRINDIAQLAVQLAVQTFGLSSLIVAEQHRHERVRVSRWHVAEELADVSIMIEQITVGMGLEHAYRHARVAKLERLEERRRGAGDSP